MTRGRLQWLLRVVNLRVKELNSCWRLCGPALQLGPQPSVGLCETHQIKYFCFGSALIYSPTPAKGVIVKLLETISHFLFILVTT